MTNYGNVNRSRFFVVFMVVILSVALSLSGCSGGGGGGNSSGVTISGTVSAPGGAIAFNQSTGLKSMLAWLFVSDAIAQANAMAPIPNVTVNLVQIDNSGNQVAILATATTDSSGNYTLTAPAGFTPATAYLVVVGSNITLSSFVTSTTVNIDPYTQTTVALITGAVSQAGASLSSVSLADVAAVQEIVVQNMANVPTNLTASQLVSALQSVIQNDIGSNNIVESIVSSGTITGTVTDSSDVPLAGIHILIRTFGNQVNQALVCTDNSGNYTISVPAGDYIIGAINTTSTSTAASQWWTSTGGTVGMWGAGKVTVVGTTPVNRNFKLGNGGRISGTITGGLSNAPLVGIVATLCDFASMQTLTWVITSTDGTYRFNVPSGNYFISFRNFTLVQPYASGTYNSTIPGGGINATLADKITITAGGAVTANINLMDGGKIEGTVTDPLADVVAGIPVRFHDFTGAFSEGVFTGADGKYRIWLQPNPLYTIYTRGQKANVSVSASTPVTQNFSAPMSEITASVKDADGKPVSMTLAQLFSASNSFLGYIFTNGEGGITHYATPGSSVKLVIAVTDGQMVGSQVYNGQMNFPTNGTSIVVPSPVGSINDLGTITLTAGAVLSGAVTNASQGNPPRANSMVQVRYGGTTSDYSLHTMRTMIDGSYTISLPAGSTVARLCAFDWNYIPGNPVACTDNIVIGASGTTTTANLQY